MVRRIPFFNLSYLLMFFAEPLFWFLGLRRQGEININGLKRVLVVRLDAIGDIVLSTPFLRELRKNLPSAWITLIVNPQVFNLVQTCPYVNEVLTCNLRISGRFTRLKAHLRALGFSSLHLWKRRFDLAITPRWDIDWYQGSLLTYISGAKKRVAYSEHVTAKKRRWNKGYDRFFTHIISDNLAKHEIEHNLDVIKFLGGKIDDDSLELWLEKADSDFTERVFEKHRVKADEVLVCFGVGSREVNKIWPIERFVKLGPWLKEKYNARILLLGDGQEKYLAGRIETELGQSLLINMTGNTTLRQAATLIKQCRIYIGNDNGLMHLAAAMKIPVIEVSCWPKSGSSINRYSPHRFGPWKVSNIVVSPAKSVDSEAGGILEVSVEDVKKAVEKLL